MELSASKTLRVQGARDFFADDAEYFLVREGVTVRALGIRREHCKLPSEAQGGLEKLFCLKWRAERDDFRTSLGDFVAALSQIEFEIMN